MQVVRDDTLVLENKENLELKDCLYINEKTFDFYFYF